MADSGLLRFLANGIRFASSRLASTYVGLRLLSDPASSFYINLPTALPGSTQAVFCDSSGNLSFAATGTVSSVGVSVPSILSVSGSPVTTSGTIAIGLQNQMANLVLAGPTTGLATTPTFRALVQNDIPKTLNSTWILDFDTQVRTSRLDQMAAPTAAVSLNSQRISNLSDGTALTDAASWGQVQSLFNGQDNKANVRVATTASLGLTSATATTITKTGGLPTTLDGGGALQPNDRILVKNESGAGATGGAANGIYLYSAGTTWVRATDADISAEVTSGLNVFVSEGGQAATLWFLATADPITLGTTSLTFNQIGAANSYLAGNGLQLSGNIFSVLGTTNRISVSGAGVDISASYAGQASIVTLGTIGSGTWQATPVGTTYGGTGANTAAGARTNLGAAGVYKTTFTSASLTAGVLTLNHNLGQQIVSVQISDHTNKVVLADDVTLSSTTQSAVDLTSYVTGFTGTWNAIVVG